MQRIWPTPLLRQHRWVEKADGVPGDVIRAGGPDISGFDNLNLQHTIVVDGFANGFRPAPVDPFNAAILKAPVGSIREVPFEILLGHPARPVIRILYRRALCHGLGAPCPLPTLATAPLLRRHGED